MSSLHGFGQIGFAEAEFADGLGSFRYAGAVGIPVSYTVLPPGSKGIIVNYDVQVHTGAAVPVVYRVAPILTDFSINGVTVPRPHHLDYTIPQQIGFDQLGVPIIQGRTQVTWAYEVMLDDGIATLMALYDPANPQVLITYPNELGSWVAKEAMWQPPSLGTRSTIEHKGVTLTFTHISSD